MIKCIRRKHEAVPTHSAFHFDFRHYQSQFFRVAKALRTLPPPTDSTSHTAGNHCFFVGAYVFKRRQIDSGYGLAISFFQNHGHALQTNRSSHPYCLLETRRQKLIANQVFLFALRPQHNQNSQSKLRKRENQSPPDSKREGVLMHHSEFLKSVLSNQPDWYLTDWFSSVRIVFGVRGLATFCTAFAILLAPTLFLSVDSAYSNRPALLILVALSLWGFGTSSTSPSGIGVFASLVVAFIGLVCAIMLEDWLKKAGPDGKAIVDAYRKK